MSPDAGCYGGRGGKVNGRAELESGASVGRSVVPWHADEVARSAASWRSPRRAKPAGKPCSLESLSLTRGVLAAGGVGRPSQRADVPPPQSTPEDTGWSEREPPRTSTASRRDHRPRCTPRSGQGWRPDRPSGSLPEKARAFPCVWLWQTGCQWFPALDGPPTPRERASPRQGCGVTPRPGPVIRASCGGCRSSPLRSTPQHSTSAGPRRGAQPSASGTRTACSTVTSSPDRGSR